MDIEEEGSVATGGFTFLGIRIEEDAFNKYLSTKHVLYILWVLYVWLPDQPHPHNLGTTWKCKCKGLPQN